MDRPTHPTTIRRARRGTAALLGLALGVGGAVYFSGSDQAGAAGVRAQAVGRFVDGAAGGNPIEGVVNVADARATNPGTVTDQNPLKVTVGGQLTLPLTGALQLPGSGNAIHLGAANQVAKAQSNGYSYGASGAVANSGGVSVGGTNGSYPAGASIDLSPSAIPTPGSIPLPGGTNLAAVGGVTATVGAVSALASTPAGDGQAARTAYNIAGLKLTIGSPALGGVLKTLSSALVAPTLPGLPAGLPEVPKSCSFATQVLSPVSIAGGAVSIDPTDGSITIDVAALLRTLGVNLNALPANTDLLGYVLNYIASPTGLGKGLEDAIASTFATQKANFVKCISDVTAAFPAPLGAAVQTLLKTLTSGQTQLTDAINNVLDKLTSAAGANPFQPVTNGLKSTLQIGVNVQPNGPAGSYRSPLKATPDQATPVVSGQTVVRAIEIDLGGGQLSLALANAAAGPSSAPAAVVTPPKTSASVAPKHQNPAGGPNAALPTGVPAGQGVRAGTPVLPIVLLALAGLMALGATVTWRLRSRLH